MEIAMIKNVAGFDGYLVDNLGNVYSQKRKKLIKRVLKIGRGYYRLGLWQNGICSYKAVHRLVAETFIPNPENKSQVNHKNGIKTDNRVENLEWSTPSENTKHAYAVLGVRQKQGKSSPFSKIVLQIKNNQVMAEYYGLKEAERQTGIFATHICAVCKKKAKSAGGYQWKYKDC